MLSSGQTVSLFGGSLQLQLVRNSGAFLSLGSSLSKPWRQLLFGIGSGCLLLALFGYAAYLAPPRPWLIFGLSLLFAGGVSNLVDRLIHDGFVVDFISLGMGPLRTGVFNIADVFITAGVALVAADQVKGFRR
jgi:signal peptidase II